MPSAQTSASLLDRVRDHADAVSWRRFADLYTPLLRHWLHRHGLQAPDADDVVQEVLTVVAAKLPSFQYDPERGRFRGWLRGVLANCLRNHLRAQRSVPTATGDSAFLASLDELEDERSCLSREWGVAHDWHVLLGLLAQIEPEFEIASVLAFRRTVLDGEPTADVAAELGLSSNAVLVAKSRVLRRLREEMNGLAD